MGTSLLTEYVKVNDLAIGPAHGKDFVFFVDDFEGLDQDGTLAPQILGAYDVDLDFAHGKLNLISSEHCPGRVVYWTQTPVTGVPIEIEGKTHIRIPVTIDGKQINAILDTGATTSYTTMQAASRYLAIDEKDPALKSRGNVSVNGMTRPVYNYPFQTLSFGDLTVNHPRVDIVSNEVWDNKTDLLLGIGILRQLHLYIAYKEKKMYITPALQD
jgi:predicted aspartyl protease